MKGDTILSQMHFQPNKVFWLVKYSPRQNYWEQILFTDSFTVQGIRNSQARNNLRMMSIGNYVYYYQCQMVQAVIGLLRVVRDPFQDPTTTDPRWLSVRLKPVKTLPRQVSLSEIRQNQVLKSIGLVRQPRLSVMPLTEIEFMCILQMGGVNDFQW